MGNKNRLSSKKNGLSFMGKILADLRGEIRGGFHYVPSDLNYNLTHNELGCIEPLGRGCFGYSFVTYAFSESLNTYVWVRTTYHYLCVSHLKKDAYREFLDIYNSWALDPGNEDFGDEFRCFIDRYGVVSSQMYDKYRDFLDTDFRYPGDRRRYCRPNFVEMCVYRDFPDSMLE